MPLIADEGAGLWNKVLGEGAAGNIAVARSAEKTDREIAKAIRHTLECDVLMPHQMIFSSVSDGWVTLEGSVPLLYQRQNAEFAVRHLAGVRGTTNRIAADLAPSGLCPVVWTARHRHSPGGQRL